MKNGPYELVVPPREYPGMLYRGKYAYEHRVNWWKETGKNPDDFPKDVIHHHNDQKRDNRFSNLVKLERAKHTSLHSRPAELKTFICENCGNGFQRRRWMKPRFCSRRCIGLFGFNSK